MIYLLILIYDYFRLIVQLRSTSSVLEEQLFSMDDSFLRKEYREKLFMNDFVTGMIESQVFAMHSFHRDMITDIL